VKENVILREVHPFTDFGVDERLTKSGWTKPIPPEESDITETGSERDGLRFFYFRRGVDPFVVRPGLGERMLLRSKSEGTIVIFEWIHVAP
jgi:hypothetical protein